MPEHFIDTLIQTLQGLPFWGIVLFSFLNAYVENIFPPAPSDVLLVFIGSMVGVGLIDFPSALISSTAGSVLGFITMFRIGRRVDRSVVLSGRYRFIPVDAIHTVESWFKRWGMYVIIVNRFLAGTRAVVAFLAGMSEMPFGLTTITSAISALVWNFIILLAGMQLGKNWREIEHYLTQYSTVVGILILIACAIGLVRWYLRSKKAPKVEAQPQENDNTKQLR